MSDDGDGDGSPWVSRWIVLATLATAAVAWVAHEAGHPNAVHVGAVAVAGALYVLYRYGQFRDRRSKYSDDDETRRREMEQKGRLGGNGGNQ